MFHIPRNGNALSRLQRATSVVQVQNCRNKIPESFSFTRSFASSSSAQAKKVDYNLGVERNIHEHYDININDNNRSTTSSSPSKMSPMGSNEELPRTLTRVDGIEMPLLGLGTWCAPRDKTRQAVVCAIKEGGYRMLDTANDYGNEHEVGAAVKECLDSGVVTRSELFLQCKLWQGNFSKNLVKYDLLATLKDLQVDYVDSFVVHWPMATPKDAEKSWKPSLVWNNLRCAEENGFGSEAELEAFVANQEKEFEAKIAGIKGDAGKSEGERKALLKQAYLDLMETSPFLKGGEKKPHTNNAHCGREHESMFPMRADGYYCTDLNCDFIETWAAMEELVDAGLCRSLGISNFTPAQVIRLLQDGCKKYKPAVLQNEMHLYLQEQDFVDFCKHHGIVFQAYSPLGSGVNNPSQPLWNPECRVIEHPVLKKIAEAKGATPAQVALRYALQRGNITVVPKSITPSRIVENIDVFGARMHLNEDEFSELRALNRCWRSLRWPETGEHSNYPYKDGMWGVVKPEKVDPAIVVKPDVLWTAADPVQQ